MDNKVIKLAVSAMFAAIICVATMVIRIPLPGTMGYVNIGDTVVLLSAWMLGGAYGAAAAAIGAGLADLLVGYGMYIPSTVIIKCVMALVAWLICRTCKRNGSRAVISYILSGVAAEAVMVVGYFIYEAFVLRYGAAVFVSALGNIVQGLVCLIVGVVVALVFHRMRWRNRS